MIGFAFTFFAIVAGFLASPYWYEFLMMYLIPQRIGTLMVVYLFAHIQHPEDVTFEEKPFQTTAYIPSSWLERFFMLGQTDHHIHHLLPNIPHYRYHSIWALGNSVLERQDVPRGSFFGPPKLAEQVRPQWETGSVVVTKVEDVAENIRAFTFEPEHGDALPRYEAGAHIALYLPSGAVRYYSLCGDPANSKTYRIAAKREDSGRGGSKEVHEVLKVGDTLTIGAPRNNFMLYEEGARFKLIAGGVGATPLMAMAHRLHTLDKPFMLHMCARNRACLPFGDTLVDLPFKSNVSAPRQRVRLEHLVAGGGDRSVS